MHFEFRLDFDYPLNHPQLIYAGHNVFYGEGRDLMSYLIESN
jgi:hypothetical protein